MSHEQGDGSAANRVNRRALLRGTAVAGVGAVGLTAASNTASAGEVIECLKWEDAPAPYPEIDLASPDVPTRDVPDTSELALYAHGWMGRNTSDDQAHSYATALEAEGYTEPVVSVTWDSNTLNFWGAERNATTAGERLAEWVRSYRADKPETTIRLAGHSLGGRLSLATLEALGGDEVIETVSLLGAAVDDDSTCVGEDYGDGIEASAGHVYNYHSRNDAIVCGLYGLTTFGSGVGCDGAECGGWFRDGETPENYTDRDVTDKVDGHCDFPLPDAGCVDQVVADF